MADDLDEVLYKELLGYESAAANAALRFEDQTSEDVRRKLYRADGRLRYWVFVYIVAIDLFSPDPSDFGRESCQAEILRRCEDCGQPQLLGLFPKARDSAWRAIVLMAESELTGEAKPGEVPLEIKDSEIEVGLLALGLHIDGSWDNAMDRLNDSIRSGRKYLLERLTKRMSKQSKKHHFLKCAILSLWVHPDFPLWLMSVEPARMVAGKLGECWGVGGSVERKAYERAKTLLAKNDYLVTSKPAVIQSVRFQSESAVPIVESFEFAPRFSLCIPKLKQKRLYGNRLAE